MPIRHTHPATRTHAAPHTTTRTTRAHPSLKTRLLGPSKHTTARHTPATTTTTTTTTRTTRTHGAHGTHAHGTHAHGTHAAPVHHHKRHATTGDKVSGALTKLKGSLTGRPGVKAAGTRRMNGTDGRGARHY